MFVFSPKNITSFEEEKHKTNTIVRIIINNMITECYVLMIQNKLSKIKSRKRENFKFSIEGINRGAKI